jgi:hypothetical protein
MDPVTLAVVGLGASALGTGVTVLGQMKSAQASADTARYQAQVNINNQLIAQQNARYAVTAGQTNAQAQDFRTRSLIGQEEAAQGASGVDLTTGSPKAVVESTRQLGRLDTLNTVQKSNLEAYGYTTQATGFGAEAQLERQKAGYATTAGIIGSTGTILGGASSFASKWNSFRNEGLLPGGGL